MPFPATRNLETKSVFFNTALTTDPAANVEISFTVPAGEMHELYAVSYTLVTSATVANRTSTLVIDDGVNIIAQISPQPVQAASLTWVYTFTVGGVDRAAAVGTNVICPLPGPLLLQPGYRIRTVTTNRDATDNYGAATMFRIRYA